ncbi:MAG: BamA/TamA family outer membrane protein [bacterium]|nr:BamA/TamA family outer membrane protein [bacterium]
MKRLFLLLLLISSFGYSQDFGKNKVRYKGFIWNVVETEHFDIYFNEGIEPLASLASLWAEEAYARVSQHLKTDVNRRIPFVLFASHYDFEQTNIILELIDEGVGGFAEVFKFRIAIPFSGSYAELHHTITHEVTHIFSYQILYPDLFESILTNQFIAQPPLWFMEGMAEYEAGPITEEGEMVLRDAVIEGGFISLNQLSDFSMIDNVYLAYQESRSLIDYIAQTYGEDKLVVMHRKFATRISLDRLIESSLGISISELEEGWRRELKRRYWPLVQKKASIKDIGKRIGDSYSFPSFSPGGDMIAVCSQEQGVLLIKSQTGEVIKRVAKKAKNSPVSFSPDGKNIGFLVRNKRCDNLFIYSVLTDKITKKIPIALDEAEQIEFVDNERLIVSGFKDGRCGLYLFDSVSGELSGLTGACDKFPSCYKNKCLFVREENGSSSVWILDLLTRESQALFSLASVHAYPVWINEDSFLFISNEDGGFNLYLCDIEKKSYAKVTNLVGGVRSFAVNPSKDKIAISVYHQGGYQLYLMELSNELTYKELPNFTPISKEEVSLPKLTKKAYSTNLSFDWRKGDFLYDSREGLTGRMNIAASDILGNHRLILSTDYASGISNLSNLAFSYHYLEKRPSMGVGIFSEKRRYFGTSTEFIDAESGIEGYIDYPLSRFRRLEFSALIEGWDRDYITPEDRPSKKNKVNLLSVGFVQDTANWSWVGPVSGSRVKLVYCLAINPASGSNTLEFNTTKADIRKYFRLSKRSVLASRLFYKESFGRDAQEFGLGGISLLPIRWEPLLRGYEIDKFWGEGIASANLELRIPFIERIDFALGFSLKSLRMLLFYDVGTYWKKEEKPKETLSSTGFGFRMLAGFLPIRVDIAYPRKGDRMTHFSLGYDF